MEQKNAIVYALINSIVYELMLKTSVYNTWVNEDTSLADLLQTITTALNGKVKTSDIVNDLVTGGRDVPLSAEMGKALKTMIDDFGEGLLVEESDPTVPDWAKAPEKPIYTTKEIPLTSDSNSPMLDKKLQEIVTALNGKYSENNPPPYPVRSVNGYGGDVELTPQLLGAMPADTVIPQKTSQLENDGGFITKAVSDLENYYRKSETYSREEIDGKISAIPKFTISVVTELPAADISETTIYLVPGGNGTDLYTEFIRVDGKWEILGSQKLDLTGYATESWVRAGYQPKGDYALVSQIPSVPTNVSAFQNDAGYLTEHQDISGKLDADKLPEAVGSEIAKFGAVSYNEQTLTEDQKAQARANIGSASVGELEAAKPFFVPVEMGEDGSSVSTEVPFADIVNAYVSNRLVYALVDGTFQLPLVGVDEELALFLLNAGQRIVMVQLNADGTGLYQMMESGGGGEAETFVVPVTLSDDTSGTIDVPFEEIANAVSAGKFVYATVEMLGVQIPLVRFDGSSALFSLSMAEWSVFVTVNEDGTTEVASVLAGGGAEPLFVEVNTDDNGNMTASTNSIEINEAAHSGRNVYAVVGNIAIPLAGITAGYAQFELTTPQVGVGVVTVFPDGSAKMVETLFGGGGSGGSGPLIVNATLGDDGNYVLDASFDEIVSAYDSGRQVYARAGQFQLALTARFETTVCFSCAMGAGEWDDLDGSMNMVSLVVYNSGEARLFNYFLADSRELESFVENIPGRIESALNEAKPDIVADVIAQLPSDEDLTYVQSEAEAVARIVNQHQSNDSIVFPFLADAHCGYYLDTEEQATKLAGQLLALIGKRVPFDFVANGGDMSSGAWDTTREKTYEHCEDYTELTAAGQHGVPSLWVPGNHDDAPYMATADRLSQKDVFLLIGRKSRLSGAAVPNGCNYGYLDLENRKLRVICLDTDDKRGWGTVEVGSGGTAPAYLNAHNVGGAQLQWLAGEALDFSGKENPEDWGIVVISHVALNVSGSITDAVSGEIHEHSTKNAAVILKDYMSGKSGSITHNGITASYDFTSLQSRAAVICAVHGHNHNFSHEILEGGILSIGCPNVMNGRERVSEDGNTYTKTAGTADGTSFCILTVDRENCLIYADCVGVGYDREFEYSTEVISYTNQLPISTDASGNVYNGKGWKEDTYLSSGNDGEWDGFYATGFIPCKLFDKLYCKNVGMQTGQDRHRVCFYNADKSFNGTLIKTNNANYTGFEYGDDGNISVFTLNVSGDNQDTAYIRLCCGYLGEDSIITVNEPIA